MKIKSEIDRQMENDVANIPVATRTEMDEVYKNLYDLKKTRTRKNIYSNNKNLVHLLQKLLQQQLLLQLAKKQLLLRK
jgi:hypothetical protein